MLNAALLPTIAAIVTRLRAAGFTDAICAGGAIRDLVNNKPVKDVDIFIRHVGGPLRGRLEAALGIPFKFICASYGSMQEVNTVWESVGVDVPIQVIELLPGLRPVERVWSMDFGMCQVWHDGERDQCTRAFELDYTMDMFTLVHCEDQREFDRSMRRWDRLKDKYPECVLMIPEEFQKYQPQEAA